MTSNQKSAAICFVSMDNLNRVPYILTYANWIDQPFDVIYWNRSGQCDSIGENRAFVYSKTIESAGDGSNKAGKLFGYIGFRARS